MNGEQTDPKSGRSIRRRFLDYFGISPWRYPERYHATFTRRLETFGIKAFAKNSCIPYQQAEITSLVLTQNALVFELEVKTGEDRVRGHEVKIDIPVDGIKLIIAALEFDRAATHMSSKKAASEETEKNAHTLPTLRQP